MKLNERDRFLAMHFLFDAYSDAISFIRTKISLALLRSSVLSLRGCRALKRLIDHVVFHCGNSAEACREL